MRPGRKPRERVAYAADRRPWDKQPGETLGAFQAFQAYLAMEERLGNGRRSHTLMAEAMGWSRSSVQLYASNGKWAERADAYDAHMGQIAQAAREKVAKEHAEKTERRRVELSDTCWSVAMQMVEKCQQMLKVGLFTETVQVIGEDGQPVEVTLEPAKWTMDTAAKFAKCASDLANMAVLSMSAAQDDGFDPLNASPEQLKAYLVKRGMKSLAAPAETKAEG